MTASDAITMLESMRRKKLQALEALEAVDPDRFVSLVAQFRLEDKAIELALKVIRCHDASNEALEALRYVATATHQAHHEGEFPACRMATCQAAINAGVK